MNRRQFLEKSSLLATLPFFPKPLWSKKTIANYKIGLQLFTVRDAMEKNPIATLKALQKMGYQDFETYGYDAISKKYYGYSPKEFKMILEDLGLSTSSGHYGVNTLMEVSEDALKRYVDRCIEGAHILQDDYIVYPMLGEKYHSTEGYQLLVKRLNQIGEQINKAGLGFAYHNFGYDFQVFDNRYGIDWIIEETHPDWVKLEVDFYWVAHAGKITPVQLIEKAKGRFPLWHIKDMHKITRDYTELGNGSIDYTKVLPKPSDSGLQYYYIEQGGNFASNSMQSVADSIQYFKTSLSHLI